MWPQIQTRQRDCTSLHPSSGNRSVSGCAWACTASTLEKSRPGGSAAARVEHPPSPSRTWVPSSAPRSFPSPPRATPKCRLSSEPRATPAVSPKQKSMTVQKKIEILQIVRKQTRENSAQTSTWRQTSPGARAWHGVPPEFPETTKTESYRRHCLTLSLLPGGHCAVREWSSGIHLPARRNFNRAGPHGISEAGTFPGG